MMRLDGAERYILQVIINHQGDAGNYVTDVQIAQDSDMLLEDVRNWLLILAGKELVSVVRGVNGLRAFVEAKGVLAWKQSLPFVSHLTNNGQKPPKTSINSTENGPKQKAIDKIFPCLDALQRNVTSYISPLEMAGEPSKEVKLDNARKASNALSSVLNANRIYIPEFLHESIRKHSVKLASVTNSFTSGRLAEERGRISGKVFWIEAINELKPLENAYKELLDEIRIHITNNYH